MGPRRFLVSPSGAKRAGRSDSLWTGGERVSRSVHMREPSGQLAGSALLPTDEALASRKPRKRFPLSGTGIDRFAVFDSRGQQPPGNKSN